MVRVVTGHPGQRRRLCVVLKRTTGPIKLVFLFFLSLQVLSNVCVFVFVCCGCVCYRIKKKEGWHGFHTYLATTLPYLPYLPYLDPRRFLYHYSSGRVDYLELSY